MPYNFAAEIFHTNTLFSRLSSRKAQFLIRKTKKIAFEAPCGGLQWRQCTVFVLGSMDSSFQSQFPISRNWTFSLGAFVSSQFARLTDRQTNRQTALRSPIPRCIQCRAVKAVRLHDGHLSTCTANMFVFNGSATWPAGYIPWRHIRRRTPACFSAAYVGTLCSVQQWRITNRMWTWYSSI